MPSLKIGDRVTLNIETLPNGLRRLVVRDPSPESTLGSDNFVVVAINKTFATIKVILPDDMQGWDISDFHVQHEKVDPSLKGKKFYDVHESLVLGIVPKAIT